MLIKGGRVVNNDMMFDADVYIEDGIIKEIGKDLNIPGGTCILQAQGKLVMPGGIDTHCHLEFPFMGTTSVDDFYSGTKAALAGGTTMIMDFVIEPGASILESFEKRLSIALSKACCDFSFHVAVTHWDEKVKEEMEVLCQKKGINSFKIFLCYDNMQLNDKEILEVFETCSRLGALPLVHAENGDIIRHLQNKLLDMGVTGPEGHFYSRSEEVEVSATHRAIMLADQVNCPVYIVHVMSKGAADVIGKMRKKGCLVYGEAIAAAIGCDGSNYFHKCWEHAAAHVLSPPLRADPTTSLHLIHLLSSGVLQVTGSDNCTFSTSQKALGATDFTKIPNGVNGIEERMALLWERGVMTGLMDPCQFVAITSSNAAKIFNIYPRKGRIQVGSDADIVVWDPQACKTISAKSHHLLVNFNIFEGQVVHGMPVYVISRGKLVVGEGQINVSQGAGQYISTPSFSPHVYTCVQQRNIFHEAVDREAEDVTDDSSNTVSSNPSLRECIPKAKFLSDPKFHSRPPTRSGGRNLQDSSFSLSGAQIDDSKGTRSTIRVQNPPGGKSAGLW